MTVVSLLIILDSKNMSSICESSLPLDRDTLSIRSAMSSPCSLGTATHLPPFTPNITVVAVTEEQDEVDEKPVSV